MNKLGQAEIGWIAGIYEGEGSCTLKGKRSLTIEIQMTDHDVLERLHALLGIGVLKNPIQRHVYKNSKPVTRFWITSSDAVSFLELVMPWLGRRRKERAEEAIRRWRCDRVSTGPSDTHCTHGHELTPNNVFATYNGRGRGCKICRNIAKSNYRQRQKALKSNAS